MKKLFRFFEKFYNKKIDGIGLDVFRIFYGIILLLEVLQIYYFRHLIFDRVPYLEKYEISFEIPLIIWIVSICAIIIGFKMRIFTLLNYVLTLIIIGTMSSFEYHAFYAYLGINFLLLFIPVHRCFSIDRILEKLTYSNTQFQYNPPYTVSQFYYVIIPFVGVGLVYFDSVFHKTMQDMWMQGIGVWLPATLPFTSIIGSDYFLNNQFLMYFLGYLTILFELTFIFLFFRKKWRIPLLIIGVGLHLGILFSFPIPWFALTAMSMYILLVPVSWWRKFQYHVSSPSLTFYYDTNCPLCLRTKIILQSLDWVKTILFIPIQQAIESESFLAEQGLKIVLDKVYSKNKKNTFFEGYDTYLQVFKRIPVLFPLYLIGSLPGIKIIGKKIYEYIARNRTRIECTEENCGYEIPSIPSDESFKILRNFSLAEGKKYGFFILSILCILLALNAIYYSPLINAVKKEINWNQITPIQYFDRVSAKAGKLSKTYLGITTHGVFVDDHFKNYNHNIRIVYESPLHEEITLPLINNAGRPFGYNSGFIWVKYSFRTNRPNVILPTLEKGIKNFTAFWAHKNNISLKQAKFKIYVQKIDTPHGWEKDFLKKQLQKPWLEGGYVIWKKNKMESHLKNIEAL